MVRPNANILDLLGGIRRLSKIVKNDILYLYIDIREGAVFFDIRLSLLCLRLLDDGALNVCH